MTKPILISWGFNSFNGNLYLDCFLDIKEEKDTSNASGIFLRSMYVQTQVSLLYVPEEITREEIESWVTCSALRDEVILKLNQSKVSKNQVIRRKLGENSIDFILYGE